MPVNINKGETEQEYISRCIGEEINSGYEQDQAAAICYSYWRKDKMSKIKDTSEKVMARVKFDTDFRGINLFAEADEDPCWSGYTQYGTKELDGKTVPNCVPDKEEMARIPIEIVGDNEEKILEYLPDVKNGEMEDTYLNRCVIVLYPEYVDEQKAYSLCADKYQRKITVSDKRSVE
jgi:hypothetical protein